MSGREEWGPWINHDGSGPPGPVGTPVVISWQDGAVEQTFVGADIGNGRPRMGSWYWSPGSEPIAAYRMRRGIEDELEQLRDLTLTPDDDLVLAD
ncbi:MAG: hypothetical protein GVY29_10085 [Spirochaetes bacterium]|jgi:hypothetical protein|nr:hypothetical protein [Spirochaetota bacterium]